MIKGNKGEWSEWYAFLKVLQHNHLYAANAQLQIIPEKYYDVLKVLRHEPGREKLTYDLVAEPGTVHITGESGELAVFQLAELKQSVQDIFAAMQAAPDRTFAIPEAERLMTALHAHQIKASNGRKDDIVLMIHDRISLTTPELGFSIKSMLGSPSTLLNASAGTNITYKIENWNGDPEAINAIGGTSKVRDRIKAIETEGGKIVFEAVESETFKKNLRKIDTVFPDIMAELMLTFFRGLGRTVAELSEALAENPGMTERHQLSAGDYEFKIKRFLEAVALGMTPQREWDGFLQAHGGYIIVREDGEIVCYHLYNLDEFRQYLFENTKLDTPSTTRHGFGTVYSEGGVYKIKLNLQIRFIH